MPSSDSITLEPHYQSTQEQEPRTNIFLNSVRQKDDLEAFETFVKTRASRIKLLDKLSDASCFKPLQLRGSRSASSITLSGPVPHEKFRKNVISYCPLTPGPADKSLRKILRHQLLHCDHPRDITKVFAVAMPRSRAASTLASLHEPLIRAIYRCRANADDFTILKLIGGIIARLKHEELPVSDDLFILGVKFAARTRSKEHMKKYLRQLRERDIPLKSTKFRAIIAKCSIGFRGLGEIRNGRWEVNDLLEVLHGFHDCRHLPPSKQYHLATFMDRNDWYYMHGYIAILSRCRDIRSLQFEWDTWKVSNDRCNPTMLFSRIGWTTTKRRGDHFFVENFAAAGALKEAWSTMQESELKFSDLHQRVQLMMLDAPEFALTFDETVRQGLLKKYDIQLSKIEAALGMRWISANEGTETVGVHERTEDFELTLERLAAPDWKFENDFGYPYDGKTNIEKSHDKALHSAEEYGPAS